MDGTAKPSARKRLRLEAHPPPHCAAKSFIITINMNDQNRVHLFDNWAKNYDYSVQSANEFPFDGYERILDRVVALTEPRPEMKVLDLGTGTGNLAERFVVHKASIWGLDFSNEMLAKAREKMPQAHFAQANLLGEWPEEFQQRYDRIISAYVFHEFDLAAKMNLLQRLAERHLADSGYFVIGDIAFPTNEMLERAKKYVGNRWDEDEYYWVAEEAICVCEDKGFYAEFEQVSSCGGIFVIKPK